MSTTKQLFTPNGYSAAVQAGDLVFLGHHRGYGDVFLEQLDRTLENVRVALRDLELDLEDLVKVNVWLCDITDLPLMEQRFQDYFPAGRFPARTTTTSAFIDDDRLVTIDGIAYQRSSD